MFFNKALSSEMKKELKSNTTFNNASRKLSRPIKNICSETLRITSNEGLIKCEFPIKWNYKWRHVIIFNNDHLTKNFAVGYHKGES